MGEILSHRKGGTVASFLSGAPLEGYHHYYNFAGPTWRTKKSQNHSKTVKVDDITNSQEQSKTHCHMTKEHSDNRAATSTHHSSHSSESDNKQYPTPNSKFPSYPPSVPVVPDSLCSGSRPEIHTSEGKTFLPPELSDVEEHDNLFNNCKFTLIRKTIFNPIRYQILSHKRLSSSPNSDIPSTSRIASRPLPTVLGPGPSSGTISNQSSGDHLGCIQHSMSMFNTPSTSQLKWQTVHNSMSVISVSHKHDAKSGPVTEPGASKGARNQQRKLKKKKELKQLELDTNFREDKLKKKIVSGLGAYSSKLKGKPAPPVHTTCNTTGKSGSSGKPKARHIDINPKAKRPTSMRSNQDSNRIPSNTPNRKVVKNEECSGEVSLIAYIVF